ncbi:MAG: fumarylacetoacetate hydrolase family protein [Candidatus Tenebribacter burtonii]|jgi:2-keto-4-pentenoate hydratase/2-oxohepta-3-ene-1,7-dioic acid hydratase in catechol pathway|nr:fumarylacetoacetate hydrolase family protein [Candidatus Tenebribacter burtonii]
MNTVYVENREITPSKIVCVGRNYVEHIKELGNEIPENMVLFIKPNSAISDEIYSGTDEPIHFEGEICFLYENGRFSAVGFGLDLTKRELQKKLKSKELPWERAKAFDGAALFSQFVKISEISTDLVIELEINGKLVQSGSIQQMIYKPDQILAEIQTFISLNDGDIVMTGTPKGVGVVNKGSAFVGRILENDSTISSGEWLAI